MKQIFLFLIMWFSLASLDGRTTKDWAQFGRYEKQNKQLTTTPKVVFMGNSITDFWVDKDPEFFSDNHFVGRGISGQTTAEMLARFRPDVIALKPKAVVILAGINDIAQNNGPISNENILNNIISMCQLAQYNHIKPILCTILPCDKFQWAPEILPKVRVVEVNNMIRQYSKANNIPLIDYYAAMANPEGALPDNMTKDHCHPTIEGYKIMEITALPIIKSVVK